MTWLSTSGTVTGPQHLSRGVGNQDVCGSVNLPADTIVLALADGAGSLPRSAEGARLAVDTVCAHAVASFGDGGGLESLVSDAAAAAVTELTSRPDSAELGCTLVVAACSPHGWAAALVGDSFAVISFRDGRHEVIRPPSAGEFANITRLLTSAQLDLLVRAGQEAPVAVTVASDGLAQQALQGAAAHEGFFTPLTRHASAGTLDMAGLLEHMAHRNRIDDDTTVLIAARPNEART